MEVTPWAAPSPTLILAYTIMSALVGKAGKKLFEKHMEQYAPVDPLYEYYTDDRGKKHRRKVREIHPTAILVLLTFQSVARNPSRPVGARCQNPPIRQKTCPLPRQRFQHWRIALWMDFRHWYHSWRRRRSRRGPQLLTCRPESQAGRVSPFPIFIHAFLFMPPRIPGWLLRRMLVNNLFSAVTGFVPFIGDVILAMFKANSRNAALLEEFLRIRGMEYLRLTEEGKDVAAVVGPKERKAEKKGKGDEKKSATGEPKAAETVAGVTKSDAQQTKPGAGQEKNELVPLESTVPSSTGPGGGTGSSSRKSGNRRGFKAWIAGGDNKDKQKGVQGGERGRFVEDIDGSGGRGGGGDALKK